DGGQLVRPRRKSGGAAVGDGRGRVVRPAQLVPLDDVRRGLLRGRVHRFDPRRPGGARVFAGGDVAAVRGAEGGGGGAAAAAVVDPRRVGDGRRGGVVPAHRPPLPSGGRGRGLG